MTPPATGGGPDFSPPSRQTGASPTARICRVEGGYARPDLPLPAPHSRVRAAASCGSGAVVLCEQVRDAPDRVIRRERDVVGEPADRVDQREQIGPAVAAGLGWWESCGHGGGSSHEPSSRDRCGGEDSPAVPPCRSHTSSRLDLGALRGERRARQGPPGAGRRARAGRNGARRRPCWANLSRVLRVHEQGMRREAASLDRERFDRVVAGLRQRYGWD
jgi:hypothetical protein